MKTLPFLLPLLLNLSALQFRVHADERPNIVVFLCDDLGYGDLGCFGHPDIKTPNLDRMASEGVRFTDFYSAAPVCSPSRVGLLTGRSPNRAGVYDWIPAANRPGPTARGKVHLREAEVTVSALLKEAGYATCMAGKWHCNAAFNSPLQAQPGDFGFDHWFGTQNNAAPSHANPKNFVRNGEEVGPLAGYSCQLVVDEAIDWLRKRVAPSSDPPFFLFLPFHEPHEPVASPPEMVATYQPVAENPEQAEYFANVANVDKAVGRLLATLTDLGKDENTLVIFTSDNGPETLRRYKRAARSYGRADPLRGMKLWTTEAGFRVPGIMRWPAKIAVGQVISEPVSSLDFLPTFCELAQTESPAELLIDGTSFLPVLENRPLRRSKPLFWCYFNAINERRVALRDGDWKILARLTDADGKAFPMLQNVFDGNVAMVRGAKLVDFQLYQLSRDVGESREVSSDHPEQLAALRVKLEQAYRELATTSHHWRR